MADVHRKIELQEQDDLRYLITNVRRAANEKIDLALPPIEGEDALRRRVEELVHEYITQTFTLATPNLSINGLPAPPTLLRSALPPYDPAAPHGLAEPVTTTEEYEPLSSKLHARAAELTRQEAELLLEIGRLRREAPGRAVGAWKEELRRSTGDGDGDGGKVDGGREGTPEALREVRLGALGVAELERQVDVERTWGQGVEGLVRLKSELPGTVARMEKAKRAGGYVLAER